MAFGAFIGDFAGGSNAGSNPNPLVLALNTGSGVVHLGDLVFVLVGQKTAQNATSVTDNLGNVYTAMQAGVLAGTIGGRPWYTIVSVAGTITAVNINGMIATNAATADACIYTGPFSAVDANPTQLSDTTSPFTPNPTGVLTQSSELVIAYATNDVSATANPTQPTGFTLNSVSTDASNAVLNASVASLVVAATTSLTPAWTNSPASQTIVGVASFAQVQFMGQIVL